MGVDGVVFRKIHCSFYVYIVTRGSRIFSSSRCISLKDKGFFQIQHNGASIGLRTLDITCKHEEIFFKIATT